MRVSSDRQAKEGESLGFQRSILLDYIRTHPDLVLVDEYMDDGVSGAKYEQRDELQRMLSDVEQGKIDLILFTKLDRFFRSVRHLMNTLDLLEKYGCEWIAIQEQHDIVSPTGKLSLTIMGAFAQMESDMDSQRTKDAFRHKISKKEWLNARPPFGYKVVNKHAVPDEHADIVRSMFNDYKKHSNLSMILRDYSPLGAPRSHKGIKQLLTNRVYIGEKHGIPDYLEPIIDRKTFDDVQRMMKMNVKNSCTHDYIFTGLIKCPCCGRVMSASTVKVYARYRCRYYMLGTCSYKGGCSERRVEKYLLDTYKTDLEQRYLKLKEVKRIDNTPKINTIYRKMDRLKELYVNELIDMDTYKKDLERYREEINTLEKPQEVNTGEIEKLLSLNVYEIYKTLTSVQKRRLWRSVIKSITPQGDSFFIEYL